MTYLLLPTIIFNKDNYPNRFYKQWEYILYEEELQFQYLPLVGQLVLVLPLEQASVSLVL